MRTCIHRARRAARAGHVFFLLAASFFLLVLIAALVIDGSLIYTKRAELSKAVDAAALAGMSHLSQGNAAAEALAIDMFKANYRPSSPNEQASQVTVQIATDPVNDVTTMRVNGTAFLNTLFIRIIPGAGFEVFPVHASATAQRARLAMSLVLDRSGSMNSNNGCVALPPAVDTFMTFFAEDRDWVSLVTYASHATTNVPITQQFQTPVYDETPRDCNVDYKGFTFIDGGLELARLENQSTSLPTDVDFVKVVVLFTDGLANVFQDTFDCPTSMLRNLSSGDGGNEVHVIDPATGIDQCNSEPDNGGPLTCCPGLTTFQKINGGVGTTIGSNAGADVRAEGKARALVRAAQLRTEGNLIYAIGLGDNLDEVFLRDIANDPSQMSTFDAGQPAGELAVAPTAAELQGVFELIARKILVRLSI